MNADGTAATRIADGTQPDWQPITNDNYDRPAAATPLHVSLVPTFTQCGTPANPAAGQHSPPLGTGACLPPSPTSEVARVGPAYAGSADLAAVAGDVQINASLTDVQTTGGADYDPNPGGADLTLAERLRITDKANGYGGAAGTATEVDFGSPIDCSSTGGPEGASCASATTANAVLPGAIKPGKAMVLQVFRVRVDDSGANGVRGDSDDRIFATQGIYVP